MRTTSHQNVIKGELMKKIFPILLIGTLSMLFAEVFSGASQTWFFEGWGLLVTYPLYLAHVLFFLWLALKWKKVSLVHLYFFGVLFGLYESWITKVLWAGYMDASGPGFGTMLGLAIPEFPILVFFWHPLMSFIMPILVFEILTGKVLTVHTSILQKTKAKKILLAFGVVLFGASIANGNQYNLLSSNLSLMGTFLLVFLTYLPSRKYDLGVFAFGKRGFIVISVYLLLLYTLMFVFALPERIPRTVLPYLSILMFYGLIILHLLKSPRSSVELVKSEEDILSSRNLLLLAALLVIAMNIEHLVPAASNVLLVGTYFILAVVGMVLFLVGSIRMVRRIIKIGAEDS
jgi:hypothetical protein